MILRDGAQRVARFEEGSRALQHELKPGAVGFGCAFYELEILPHFSDTKHGELLLPLKSALRTQSGIRADQRLRFTLELRV
jgi:hypothetical protein